MVKSNTYPCVVDPYVIVFRFMHMYNANVPNIYSNVIYLCVNEK